MRKVAAYTAEASTRSTRIGQGRFGLRPAGSVDTLAGRETELAVLRAAFALAGAGHAQVVEIEGEPGMGKSALLATFLDTCGSGAELWVRCDEFEAEVAFATVALLADDPNLTTSDVEAGRRLLARVSDLQSSTSGVTVLAVDDAQWMDRSSANALRFALSRLRTDRVLAVIARRTHTVTGGIDVLGEPDTVVRPTPLDAGSVSRLAAALRSWDLPPGVAEDLARRTGGSPLLLRAILRAAAHPGQLEAGAELSASVAAAARRLLDSVPLPARRLVEASAIVSAPCSLAALSDIAEVADPSTAAGAAEAAGLLTLGESNTADQNAGVDLPFTWTDTSTPALEKPTSLTSVNNNNLWEFSGCALKSLHSQTRVVAHGQLVPVTSCTKIAGC